ncbi:MAG: dihydrodipicolinate synthase family protein [Actinomycetota bacterium]|nr:dihydrodipicolinate synthase family protein [Actinomycetota bacterium]
MFKYAKDNFGSQANRVAELLGSNDTRHTVQLSRQAEQLGVDASLIVTPDHNKPTPEGVYRHFEAVASKVSLPIIVEQCSRPYGHQYRLQHLYPII